MDLTIYPQNWIHNANVYGFLKVIHNSEKKLSFSLEDILKDDGTIVLTDRMQDELYQTEVFDGRHYPKLFVLLLEETKKMNGDDLERAYFHFKGKNAYYANFIAKYLKEEEREDFLNELSRVINKIFVKPRFDGDETCFFCGNRLSTKGIKDVENQRKFSLVLFKTFSSTEKEFPNAFWNMSNKYYLCEVCSQMALFRHFVFPKKGEGIFINIPSFKAIWYLNEAYRAHKELVSLSGREELVLSRVVSDVSIKLQRLLGVWERQNVEIISVSVSKETFRNYYLPADIVDLLLNTFVSSILNTLNSNEIFGLVAQRRFSEILDLEYLVLKTLEKGDKSLRDVLSKKWKISNLRIFSELLPELFSSIRNIQGVSGVTFGEIKKLRDLGKSMAQSFERTRYRLLELIRLGKREEVYHILLRTYMASNVAFPEELNRVFTYEDEDFKNAMFAYVSGMTLPKEEEVGGEGE